MQDYMQEVATCLLEVKGSASTARTSSAQHSEE